MKQIKLLRPYDKVTALLRDQPGLLALKMAGKKLARSMITSEIARKKHKLIRMIFQKPWLQELRLTMASILDPPSGGF